MNFTQMHYLQIVFAILCLMITAVVADLQYALNIKSANCGGCAFFSFHADLNNFATTRKQGTNKISSGFQDSQYMILTGKANFVPFTSFQIRTSSLNENFNASNYVIFNSTFSFYFPSLQTIYTASSLQSIVDSVFGETLQQVFALVRSSKTNSKYVLYRLFNGNLTVSYQLTVLGTTPLAHMVYRNRYIFIHFQAEIQVLAFNNSFNQVYRQNYRNNFTNTTDFSKVDIDAQQTGSTFCFTTPVSLFLVSTLNFAITQLKLIQDFGISSNEIVISARFALQRYIVLSTNTNLYQYDLILKRVINSTSLIASGNFTSYYLNIDQSTGVIILVPKVSGSYSTIYEYNISTNYYCTSDGSTPGGSQMCNSCLEKYLLDQSNLNCYIPIVIPQLPQPSNIAAKDQPNFLNSETARTISSALGQTLSLSSLRITPKFLLAFVCFLDDLWYYQYHRKQYPVVVTYAFANVDIANDIRFDSWVTSIIKSINQKFVDDYLYSTQNQKYQSQIGFSDSDPDVYFSYSSRQFYRLNILQCLLLYCVLKILQLIFQQLKDKARIFAQLDLVLKNGTRWWCIIVTLIESNIVRLTFYSSLQFKIPINFDFEDKINLTGNFFLFFVLFIYSLCFYLLVYTWESLKQPAEELLARSCYNFKSFLLEPYYLIGRGLIRAAIHGFFIQNYQLQIFLLFFIDILTLPFIIKIRNFFLSRFTFVFTLCYSIAFAAFDLYFVVETHFNLQISLQNSRETVGLVFLCFLFGFTVLIALSLVILNICRFIKLIYKRLATNDISPYDQSRPTQKSKPFIFKTGNRKIIILSSKHKKNPITNQNSPNQPIQAEVNDQQIKTIRRGSGLINGVKIVEKIQYQVKKSQPHSNKIKNQRKNKMMTFMKRMHAA